MRPEHAGILYAGEILKFSNYKGEEKQKIMLDENLKTYPKSNMLIVKPVTFCISDEKLQRK